MPDGPLQALDDTRVLDLSDGIAGSYCSKLLADAGATVVKVEPPSGHPLRSWSVTGSVGKDGDPDGALFRFLAAGQHSAVADPQDRVGRERILELAATADIVVESFPPGFVDSVGIGCSAVHRANPAAVVVSITPFGSAGPRRQDSRNDFLLQALCGSLDTQGTIDGGPLQVGGAVSEWIVGAYAATGALTALSVVRQTGRGSHVDISRLECLAVTLVCYPSVRASLPGGGRQRHTYSMIPAIEPCRDGFVGLTTLTVEQWKSFLAMIDRPDLAEDTTLYHHHERLRRRDEILPAVHAWTMERSAAEIVERAALFRVPAAPVLNGATIGQLDHLVSRGSFERNPRGGLPHPRSPSRTTATSPRAPRRAPVIGQGPAEAPRPVRPSGPPAPSAGPRLPLEGVRVLDFTAFWAGPYATQFLGALGADVIKVESIQRPDPMRFNVNVAPTVSQWYEQSYLYLSVNLNKRGVTLNLADPKGRELALALAARSDVVIENYSPRVFENFGLTYEDLQAARPDIVMVRMPGWGLAGPWRERPGFATTMEQAGGLAWVTGYDDGPPLAPGLCDPLAGVHAAFAVLAGLQERRATGRGQQIELSMIDMAVNVAAEQILEQAAYGQLLTRRGNRDDALASPQGVYRCADPSEWVAISVTSDEQWAALMDVVRQPGSADGTGRRGFEDRRAAQADIEEHIADWCSGLDHGEVLARLHRSGVPAERVVPAHDIDRDIQMRSRGFWETVKHPVVGSVDYPAWPIRLPSQAGRFHRSPAPLLGQHNEEVLGGLLGLSTEEITSLRDADVIGERPLGL